MVKREVCLPLIGTLLSMNSQSLIEVFMFYLGLLSNLYCYFIPLYITLSTLPVGSMTWMLGLFMFDIEENFYYGIFFRLSTVLVLLLIFDGENLWMTLGLFAILLFIGISYISSKKLSDSPRLLEAVTLAATLLGATSWFQFLSSKTSLLNFRYFSLMISFAVGTIDILIST